MPTGSGKTVVFSEIIKRTVARGNKCVVLVRGRQLIYQASERLAREEIDHGIIMAGFKHKDSLVQVASADTVITRKLVLEASLLVVDEAHLAVKGNFKNIVESFQNHVVSVTATPYTKESMRHLADVVVQPITMLELIKQGYLVNAKYFAPNIPNLKGIKIQAGDYHQEQLSTEMAKLTGDIVQHWQALGQNRPTLCFAVNIEHSQKITAAFNQAGIPCEHIEAKDSLKERKAIVSRLESGEIKIISSVNTMCTGVDIPFLSCLIMARPTKSYNLFIQQAGRGTRIYPNKENFLILDHAGNTLKHGFITQEQDVNLDGKPKKEFVPQVIICKKCYLAFSGSICPDCQWNSKEDEEKEKLKYEVKNDGSLIELTPDYALNYEINLFIKKIKATQQLKGYKKLWMYFTLKNKYGEAVAAKAFPRLYSQAQFISRKYPSPSG